MTSRLILVGPLLLLIAVMCSAQQEIRYLGGRRRVVRCKSSVPTRGTCSSGEPSRSRSSKGSYGDLVHPEFTERLSPVH